MTTCKRGVGRRNPQVSIDRGFFYVYASKIGTVQDDSGQDCVEGNYMPAWVTVNGNATYKGARQVAGSSLEALQAGWFQCMKDTCSSPGMACRRASATWMLAKPGERRKRSKLRSMPSSNAFAATLLSTSHFQKYRRSAHGCAFSRQIAFDIPCSSFLGHPLRARLNLPRACFSLPWTLELKVGDTEVFPAKMVEFKRNFHDALILDDVLWLELPHLPSRKASREVRQQDRICDHTGWHMLLHEVSFQDPHCRDCQLHHAALGFFAQQRLAQQTPEHSVAEVATACMRMVLALKCQCLAPPLYSQWPCMFPETKLLPLCGAVSSFPTSFSSTHLRWKLCLVEPSQDVTPFPPRILQLSVTWCSFGRSGFSLRNC